MACWKDLYKLSVNLAEKINIPHHSDRHCSCFIYKQTLESLIYVRLDALKLLRNRFPIPQKLMTTIISVHAQCRSIHEAALLLLNLPLKAAEKSNFRHRFHIFLVIYTRMIYLFSLPWIGDRQRKH